MPYDNPREIEPNDFEKLKALSLGEEGGKPVLYLAIELRQHRQYDHEISALFLPGVDPRRLYPETYPDKEAVADTDEQEVVQAPAADEKAAEPESPKSSSKKAKSDATQETASPAATEPAKSEDVAPVPKSTGQGG